MRRNYMIVKMASEYHGADFVECTVDGLDLLEHIHAVDFLVLQHLEDALDMPLDREQASTGTLPCSGVKMQAVTLGAIHGITSAR